MEYCRIKNEEEFKTFLNLELRSGFVNILKESDYTKAWCIIGFFNGLVQILTKSYITNSSRELSVKDFKKKYFKVGSSNLIKIV